MNDDPIGGLLDSPLDDPRPGRRRRVWSAVGAALAVAALVAVAVVVWGGGGNPVEDTTTAVTLPQAVAGFPEARLYAPMVATDAGVFMFGGLAPVQHRNGVRFDDVWRYDSATGEWWDVQVVGGPPPRAGAAVAYDAGSGVVVLFGGAVGSCSYPLCPEVVADTWVYHPTTNTWEERSPATSPPARHGHKLAYDAASDRVVLFGGDTGEQWLDDTWAYDSDTDTWVEVPTADAPWRTAQQAMAYDPVADRVVLWGGAEREESEVWTLDLETATWSSMATDPAPVGGWDACLAWDAASERLLLIGGEGPNVVQISEGITAREVGPRDEVWALDLGSGTWTLLGRLPRPMTAHGCAADAASAQVVIWDLDSVILLDPATGQSAVAEGPAGT